MNTKMCRPVIDISGKKIAKFLKSIVMIILGKFLHFDWKIPLFAKSLLYKN
jgi:hypothetical protein